MGPIIARKPVLAFALALALSTLVMWQVWRASERQRELTSQSVRARELLAALDGLGSDLAEADTRRCAFVVRADPAQWKLWHDTDSAARHKLGRLAQLLGEADTGLLALEPLVTHKLDLLAESVRLRERQRFATRAQQSLSERLRDLDPTLHGTLASLRRAGDGALAQQALETRANTDRTVTTVCLAGLFTLAVVGVGAVGVSRELGIRTRAHADAQQARFRAENQAEERAAQLRRTQAALDDLAAVQANLQEQCRQTQQLASVGGLTRAVLHDFNNLLLVTLSCSEATLRGLPANDPARPFLAEAVQAGHQTARLMRQLLFVGRPTEAPLPQDLNCLLTDSRFFLKRLAGPGVEVEMDMAPDLGPVFLPRGQLEQVLLNLVANARDAMPNGGKLTLKTSLIEHPRCALLLVRDTGCGMDAEVLARVFEPFFTTKGGGKGTGLGLAIVADVARTCGGQVEVESEPGHGTTFRIHLPLLGHTP